MKNIALFCLLIGSAIFASGPDPRDREAILAMAGTFAVDFHFKETVGFQPGYDLTKAYDSAAMETVIVVEAEDTRIVLQHILQTSHGIVKHWRQDWEYQSRELLEFQGDQVWKKRELSKEEVAGTWTQRVFQVDDSPRYEAYGKWVHMGNLSQWESELTARPLPRREYTKRDDYNILMARNRHTLTLRGWVHEQDNFKLRRTEDGDHIIARETGLNSYDRTHERNLAEADAWWEERGAYWADVRAEWAKVYAGNPVLFLKEQVEDKPLYRHIFKLGNEVYRDGKTYDSERTKPQIKALIDQFIGDPNKRETET